MSLCEGRIDMFFPFVHPTFISHKNNMTTKTMATADQFTMAHKEIPGNPSTAKSRQLKLNVLLMDNHSSY